MKRIKRIAELALINSLGLSILEEAKPGRLKNRSEKLVKCVKIERLKLGRLYDCEKKLAQGKIDHFGDLCGWFGKEKHVATFANFIFTMMDNSENAFSSELKEAIVDIFDYYDRVGDTPNASFWSADLALEKWNSVFV